MPLYVCVFRLLWPTVASIVESAMKLGAQLRQYFVGYIEHQFFNQYDGPKPELYRRYIDYCVAGATSSTREKLNQFITAVNSFHPAFKYGWQISDNSLSKFPLKATVYAPACTTNPQILIVICCNHLHIHHMSRIPFLIARNSEP